VVKVQGSLSEEELRALLTEVENRCPVSDTLGKGTVIEGKLVRA
jgi:uncharacterized OsmC-like protein